MLKPTTAIVVAALLGLSACSGQANSSAPVGTPSSDASTASPRPSDSPSSAPSPTTVDHDALTKDNFFAVISTVRREQPAAEIVLENNHLTFKGKIGLNLDGFAGKMKSGSLPEVDVVSLGLGKDWYRLPGGQWTQYAPGSSSAQDAAISAAISSLGASLAVTTMISPPTSLKLLGKEKVGARNTALYEFTQADGAESFVANYWVNEDLSVAKLALKGDLALKVTFTYLDEPLKLKAPK